MDCIDGMKCIPDGSIDAIICDLPYGVLNKKNPSAVWDKQIPLDKLWSEYERVIKKNGAIILFGQGMFTAELMMSNKKHWRYNLIWDKCKETGFLNANRMPMRCHEDILVFYKSLPKYHPQFTDGDVNHPRGKGKHNTKNQCYGSYNNNDMESKAPPGKKYPRSIISLGRSKKTFLHPTQKPVNLIRYLIRTYTDTGETVLDSCIGSGSTAIACMREDRNFVGFELDDKYYEVAKKRIETEQMQLTLPLN